MPRPRLIPESVEQALEETHPSPTLNTPAEAEHKPQETHPRVDSLPDAPRPPSLDAFDIVSKASIEPDPVTASLEGGEPNPLSQQVNKENVIEDEQKTEDWHSWE